MNSSFDLQTKLSILHSVDHTQLSPTAGWNEIRNLCEEALQFQTASVCIAPVYVRQAKEYIKQQLPVCTVIGFPNGYQATRVKVFETKAAIQDGADEIDMVIQLGWVKDGNYALIEKEIKTIKEACQDKLLKVIIETCLLTEEEKISMCKVVTNAGADFIKTSTGFSKGGAALEDIALFRTHVGERVQIKASGGITTFEDAKKMLEFGASRLGTSRLVRLVKKDTQTILI